MTDTAEKWTCIGCEEQFDENEEITYDRWHCEDGMVCWPCYEGALESAGTCLLVTPDGMVRRYTVSRFAAMDEDGDEPYGDDDPKFSLRWVSTDAWRGYNDIKIEGWVTIPGLDGWTTGWVDETTMRKNTINAWIEDLMSDEPDNPPPFPIAISINQTSNVFSTAITILCKEEDLDEITTWLGDEKATLSDALR